MSPKPLHPTPNPAPPSRIGGLPTAPKPAPKPAPTPPPKPTKK